MTVSVSWDVTATVSRDAYVEIHKQVYVPVPFVAKTPCAPSKAIRPCVSALQRNHTEIHWWNAQLRTKKMVLVIKTQIALPTWHVSRGNVSTPAVLDPLVDTVPFAKWYSTSRAANVPIVTLENLT
jgi:hypothetical protein